MHRQCKGKRRRYTKWQLLLGLLALLACAGRALAQPAAAPAGQVSETQLRHFLSRALTLQELLLQPAADRQQLLPWASRLGTRFAGRVGGFWATPGSDARERAWYDSTRRAVQLLRASQPEIVVQGAVFEIVFAEVEGLTVPNAIRAEFGEDTLHPRRRHFRLADMMYREYFLSGDSTRYRWDSRPPGQAPGTPDMSRRETQMWFYFCARRQLDAGCEALHFGQVDLMDDRDPGHAAWWSMLSRVRRYARTRNRGFVLCDAHTHGEYYDPDPAHPAPDSLRQLLFDFHGFPARPTPTDTLRQGQHGTRIDYWTRVDPYAPIYQQSRGGITPSGWRCQHLPALVELDNGGDALPFAPSPWPSLWGMDEISWFATQPQAYRSHWLTYAYGRVRQIDPDAYFEAPGLRVVHAYRQPVRQYRADLDGQGPTLRRAWQAEPDPATEALLLLGPPTEAQQRQLEAAGLRQP